jgi:hypothetical protein
VLITTKIVSFITGVFNILFDKFVQCPMSGGRFSPGTVVSSGNNARLHNIPEVFFDDTLVVRLAYLVADYLFPLCF